MSREIHSASSGAAGLSGPTSDFPGKADGRARRLEEEVRELRRLLQKSGHNGDRLASAVLDHRVQEAQRRLVRRPSPAAPTRARRAFDRLTRYLQRLPLVRQRARSQAQRKAQAARKYLKDEYVRWIELHEPSAEEKQLRAEAAAAAGYQPPVSIVLAIRRPRSAAPHQFVSWISRTVYSVCNQRYPHWELCVAAAADSDPRLANLLRDMARRDPRVRLCPADSPADKAAAWEAALALAGGDYVCFLDQYDQLAEMALCDLVLALQEGPDTDLAYGDEDQIDSHGNRSQWRFKPGWSPELLSSQPYLGRAVFFRRRLLGPECPLESFDDAGRYGLALRLTERKARVKRIPRVLYHRGAIGPDSASGGSARHGERAALQAHLERTAPEAELLETAPGAFHVRRARPHLPRVAVLVACPEGAEDGIESLETACREATGAVCDFTRVETAPARDSYLYGPAGAGLPGYSRAMNAAARASAAPYLLFLEPGALPAAAGWLQALLDYVTLPGIGAAGGMLLAPSGAIRHAGYVLAAPHLAVDAFRGLPWNAKSYGMLASSVRNVSAVSRACLLIRREAFEEAGGFEDRLSSAFHDVDLCLKLRERGWRTVYTPAARLSWERTEPLSASASARDVAYLLQRWRALIEDDPYYHPGLSKGPHLFRLRLEE